MKQLFTLMLSLSILHYAPAQSIQLENVTKEGFKGIQYLQGEQGYYVQYIEGNSKKNKIMHVYILNNDLKSTADFVLTLTTSEKVEDIGFNGENFMVIYSSKGSRTRTFKVLDKKGIEVATNKLTKVNRRLLEKPAVIMPSGSDFVVLNYIKEKKIGYSLDRYNSNLEQIYSESQIPEKKKLYPVDYLIKNDRVYVLEFMTTGSEYFEYYVSAYDAGSGKQLHRNYLKNEADNASGYATFIKVDDDHRVFSGGMYFNGNRTKKNNSDGFFAATIDTDGKMNFSNTDWRDVKSDLKDEGNAAFWGGKTKTFMQDLSLNPDGSFTLIGENYRRGSADLAGDKKGGAKALGALSKANRIAGNSNDEPEEIAVTVSGFALLDFDKNANFLGLRKIDKPNSVTVVKETNDPEDPTYIGQRKGLNIANILNNVGYFPYRFVANKNGEKILVYHMKYESLTKEFLYFTPLSATEMDTTSIEITGEELRYLKRVEEAQLKALGGFGKLAGKLNKSTEKAAAKMGTDIINNFYLKGSHDPYDFRSKSYNSRTLLSNNPGKIVLYDFTPESQPDSKGKLAALMATTVGSLRIWQIDIP